MKLDFSQIPETVLVNFKGGEKSVRASMYVDSLNRIMRGSLEPGASIGSHCHETSSEIIYVISGQGKAVFGDGSEEIVNAGDVHYCPKGTTHSFVNDGEETIQFLAVVPEQ